MTAPTAAPAKGDPIADPAGLDVAIDRARHALLAELILRDFTGVGLGHCARVNYLDRPEAGAVAQAMRERDTSGTVDVAVLAKVNDEAAGLVTSDRAIELRNRKLRPLCLFIPGDIVDSAASSLANSFAEISGITLYQHARQEAQTRLTDPDASQIVRDTRRVLTGRMRPGDRDLLDLILSADRLAAEGRVDRLGRELWRVGLVPDDEPGFAGRLARNREVTTKISRPLRAASGARQRLADTKVDTATAGRVATAIGGRPLADVRQWARSLVDTDLTFDRWVFPEQLVSDLTSVTVAPFVDRSGALLKGYVNKPLLQPDGPGGTLFLPIRPDEKVSLKVSWVTEPKNVQNVTGWRVALMFLRDTERAEQATPGGSDAELDFPTKDVKGDKRTVTLSLAFDVDTEPENEIVARVSAIDATGTEITGPDGQPIYDLSGSFFIRLTDADVVVPFTERRTTVPSLAEGQLGAALEAKPGITDLTLAEPEWRDVRGTRYFSLKVPEARRVLTVGLSGVLTDLQAQTLADPAGLGRWRLDLDELKAAAIADIAAIPPTDLPSPHWARFQSARVAFFSRLRPATRKGETAPSARTIVEVADWTEDLTGAVTRHAQAYRALLDGLTADGAPGHELQTALSIDSLSVRIAGHTDEVAVITLPTHPLRALWLASHAALLGRWQRDLLEIAKPADRAKRLDRQLVRDLRPVNVPPFPVDPVSGDPFVFFRTLAFGHGIALPAAVRDPVRRVGDLMRIVGLEDESTDADDRAPEQLGRHLERFAEVHPYADPLQIAIVNPDRGALLAGALKKTSLFSPALSDPDGDDVPDRRVPLLDVTAYVLDRDDLPRTSLTQLRQAQGGAVTRHTTDFLYPRLATRVRALDDLLADRNDDLAAAHLAVVSDLCEIAVGVAPAESDAAVTPETLHGLLTRFRGGRVTSTGDPASGAGDTGVTWRYRTSSGRASRADNPAGAAFGTALGDGLDAVAKATAGLIRPGTTDLEPVVEVSLSADLISLLDTLHLKTDWVVTIDRFFGIDYFDSPNDPLLGGAAARHLIDYSPDFADGLGHRIIVSTAFRDEVESTLRRALVRSGHPDADQGEVTRLLEALKRVSGRLALQALTPTGGSQAVGLAVTLRWLEAQGRLPTGILLPIEVHRDLFSPPTTRSAVAEARRCDLVLVAFGKGGAVELNYIEVKNRRGPLGDLDELADGMAGQLRTTRDAVRARFFDPERIDAPLQRMVLGSLLRFYVERAQRHGLMAPGDARTIERDIARYERSGAELRDETLHGVVVSLNDAGRPEIDTGDIRVTVLTRAVLASATVPPPPTPPTPPPGLAPTVVPPVEPETVTAVEPTPTPEPEQEPEKEPGRDPAPVAVEVVLGDDGGRPVTWSPGIQGSPHLFITGIPGQGKSVAIRTILKGLAAAGVPALVFDFHGEFAGDVARWAPMSGPLSRPTVADAADGLPFSPFALGPDPKANDIRDSAQAVAEIFGYVCGLGDIQQDTVRQAVADAYAAARLRADPAAGVPTMADVLHRLERRAREDREVRRVLIRCRPLLEFGLFRDASVDQQAFQSLLDGGLIVRLDEVRSEQVQDAASAFVIRKVYREMFDWERARGLRLAIVLDEAHRLVKDATLPKLLKEGRKYGVLVVSASQGLSDFDPEVLANVGTKVAFRTNNPESRRVAGYFTGDSGDVVRRIERLGVGEAVVQTPEMSRFAVVTMRRV